MSMEHIGDNTKTGQRSPKPSSDSKYSHSSGKDINILVLGKHRVGKTGNFCVTKSCFGSNCCRKTMHPSGHIKIAPSICPSVRLCVRAFFCPGHNYVLHEWISI